METFFPVSSTHNRVMLAGQVITLLDIKLDEPQRRLIYRVVGFLTGSDMFVDQFDSTAFRPDEIERSRILLVIDLLTDVVTNPKLPFDADMIDEDRVQKLRTLIDKLDATFDVKTCASKVFKIIMDGYYPYIDKHATMQIEDSISYLSGAGTDEAVKIFAAKLAYIEDRGVGFGDSEIERLELVISVMQRSYPGSVLDDRRERLERAFKKSRAFVPASL